MRLDENGRQLPDTEAGVDDIADGYADTMKHTTTCRADWPAPDPAPQVRHRTGAQPLPAPAASGRYGYHSRGAGVETVNPDEMT